MLVSDSRSKRRIFNVDTNDSIKIVFRMLCFGVALTLEKIDDWDFDVFALQQHTQGGSLVCDAGNRRLEGKMLLMCTFYILYYKLNPPNITPPPGVIFECWKWPPPQGGVIFGRWKWPPRGGCYIGGGFIYFNMYII